MIRTSEEGFDFLANHWRWHIDDAIYYTALKACMSAKDGIGSHEEARLAFLEAIYDADIWVYPR